LTAQLRGPRVTAPTKRWATMDGPEHSHDHLGDALARAGDVNGAGGSGPLHVLILCDRDWTHPQGGGSGANLLGQSSRWLAWGNRVSVISCAYPEGPAYERPHERLEMHRFGTRSTVFPRAIWRQWRRLVPDADVVLEVINGVTFLTPLWLRTPHVALVNHCHCFHYREEMGSKGRVAALALERAPLRLLYGRTPFVAVSHSTAAELVAHGIPRMHITVNYTGLDPELYGPGRSAEEPTLLYLGRLKRYKHVEELLEVLERVPGAVLDIAGDGDQRPMVESEIERRGLAGRVRLHGPVDDATKLELMRRAWVNLSASRCEGWGLSVVEAAACGTPTAAITAGGLTESIVDGQTGLLARDVRELTAKTMRLVADDQLRERMGRAAMARAQTYSWDAMAATTLRTLQREHARANGLAWPVTEREREPAAPAFAQRGAKNSKKGEPGRSRAARR
jgi:glycosyltransferase involved in cell wall biosynthesis